MTKRLRFIFRFLLLAVPSLFLLGSLAWAFGALWYDFPIPAARHLLAIFFAVSTVAVAILLPTCWKAKAGMAVAILAAKGDVGGFGVSSDLAWTLQGTIGYPFTPNVSSEIGYRYLHTDYTDGGFKYDVAQAGLYTGHNIKFC